MLCVHDVVSGWDGDLRPRSVRSGTATLRNPGLSGSEGEGRGDSEAGVVTRWRPRESAGMERDRG